MGVLHALTLTNTPAETWSRTHQPGEGSAALPAHGYAQSGLSRGEEPRLGQSWGMLELIPAAGVHMGEVTSPAAHLCAEKPGPPKEGKVSPRLHSCRISYSCSAVKVSIVIILYWLIQSNTNKCLVLKFLAEKVPIQQIQCGVSKKIMIIIFSISHFYQY